jgi:(S)-mandelate dehydrogenase
VLIGRAGLYGLGAGGGPGAARAIDILANEIDRVIGLLGTDSIAGLDPSCVRWRSQGRLYRGASGEGLES